jgi:PAS domain S-box-containing protein
VEQETVLGARKSAETESVVPHSSNRRETVVSLGAVCCAAFALTALFGVVKTQIEPRVPQRFLETATIGFETLLATGLALLARREILNKSKIIECERDLLRVVTDGLPAGIFAKDLSGRYIMANRKFAEFKGARSGAEIVGKTAYEFMPEDEAVTVASEDYDIKSGKSRMLELERSTVNARGKVIWDRTTRVPLNDANGKIVGIAGLQRDITRSKHLEERLKEEESRLLAAQQIAQLGSFEVDLIEGVDLERCPMRCSSQLLRIAGFDPRHAELPRTSTNIFHLVIPKTGPGRARRSPRQLKTRSRTWLIFEFSAGMEINGACNAPATWSATRKAENA